MTRDMNLILTIYRVTYTHNIVSIYYIEKKNEEKKHSVDSFIHCFESN